MREQADSGTGRAFGYVTILFFVWGAVTSINDVMVPAVRSIFSLSVTEGLLTQFAFFLAYGIVSLPAAALVGRLGASRSITLALFTMVAGCLLMPVATAVRAYWIVLLALFVIASGITLLQVAANPLSAALGRSERSHFRLALSQAFNSLGTLVAPPLAATLLLTGGLFAGGAATPEALAQSLRRIDIAYAAIAIVIILLAGFLWRQRGTIDRAGRAGATEAGQGTIRDALRSPFARLGAMAIFLYVGAEVSIGSVLVNFLEQPAIAGVTAERAGQMLAFYWGGAMLGRFAGSALLTRMRADRLLALAALAAAILCGIVIAAAGTPAAIAALAIGLFNSIMFPTIFTITLDRSSAPPAATAGMLCVAIVGGAVVPLLFGAVSRMAGLSGAFVVPAICYAAIALFAVAVGLAPVAISPGRSRLSASH
ncbi:glucose/galactose MFS transporter [Sphingomonas sp.]|uniref:glucose/galactose MFS transporter n=1 Tax=Sphingomonas sp. TaxID=28214 RepID=UPI000DB187B5|nr:glucose/galactose MFS transporter [Sphingomonas sp.]PZU11083.1 MAG: glucose/galactose MFS transporter [Sphingomonas sp.]